MEYRSDAGNADLLLGSSISALSEPREKADTQAHIHVPKQTRIYTQTQTNKYTNEKHTMSINMFARVTGTAAPAYYALHVAWSIVRTHRTYETRAREGPVRRCGVRAGSSNSWRLSNGFTSELAPPRLVAKDLWYC